MASSSPISSSSSVDSSSPISYSCMQCQNSSSEPLMNGWKSRVGGYAQLCYSCYSLYEAGQFCETFHAQEDGWRDCKSCNKLFHCGCIVSLSNYSLDAFGGIKCLECSRTNFALPLHCATAGSNTQDLEMQSSTAPKYSVCILLFEKLMTNSDVKLMHRGIRIPNTHAKAYFPEISEGQVIPVHVLDTDGKGWDFFYHCWVHKQYTTHVLQGLEEFMRSKNLKTGDTVAFYRREADEKMILEVKKTSAGKSSHQAST